MQKSDFGLMNDWIESSGVRLMDGDQFLVLKDSQISILYELLKISHQDMLQYPNLRKIVENHIIETTYENEIKMVSGEVFNYKPNEKINNISLKGEYETINSYEYILFDGILLSESDRKNFTDFLRKLHKLTFSPKIDDDLLFFSKLNSATLKRIVRSNLAEEIRKAWIDNGDSINQPQHIKYMSNKNGVLTMYSKTPDENGRFKDASGIPIAAILEYKIDIYITIYYYADDDTFATRKFVTTTDKMVEIAKRRFLEVLRNEETFTESESAFIKEKPWEKIIGVKPKQAFQKLKQMGW